MIEGTREPFEVEYRYGDSVTGLKNKIKLALPSRLPQDASTLSLYKALRE